MNQIKKENIVVSIFVITYNQENYIKETIFSILNQILTYEFEIIILDDCSTDNTSQLCLEIQRQYNKIKYIRNIHNLGLIRNYHTNIAKYATGKYIAQCAGDDYWIDQYKLQKQVDFLELNPDYGLIHTSAKAFYTDRNKFLTFKKKDKTQNLLDFFVSNKVFACTVCFKRDIYIKYLSDINPIGNNWFCEDYPMWLYFAGKTRVKAISDVTAVYRVTNNSISRSANLDKRLNNYLSRIDIINFFIKYFKVDKKVAEKSLYSAYYNCECLTIKTKNQLIKNKIIDFYKISGRTISTFRFKLYYKYNYIHNASRIINRYYKRLLFIIKYPFI